MFFDGVENGISVFFDGVENGISVVFWAKADLKFADFQYDSRKKSQNGEKDVDVKRKIDQQFKAWEFVV